MSQVDNSLEPKWYVVHTYSGYENKVKTDLEKTIKNRELEDFFFNIVVPMEEQVEIKDGKRKTNLKKVFPGYVLVKMIVTEESWYIVRNTRGVTGFVGSGTDPIPLTDDEIRRACELAIRAGADYVKTGSGFSSNPTTIHHVKVITDTVGDRVKLKVAGGVRDLSTLLKMYKLGACRFGIGCASAEKILAEVDALGGAVDINSIVIDEAEL